MSVPTKFLLDPGKAVLVVIDVQERLCAAMEQNVLAQLTRNAGILLESANELNVPVIFSEQYVKGLGPTLNELRSRAPTAPAIEKMTFSCCGNDAFLKRLKETGRTQVIVCGMETHVCVLQTVIELLGEGFNVHLVKDAVMSRSSDNRQTAIEAMVLAGAVPSCTEAVVFQLLKIAGTETFKKLSKLVK
ncbi:MAG: hydrolase [Nitrosomonadales bacterium]|nr:hydrolase [Nitrosomonadales bacterium]